jgi:uncharacterized YccA/Bax inhibitor family protein
MAESGNPTLAVSRFKEAEGEGVMTIRGTIWRAFVLVGLVIASSAYTWWSVANGMGESMRTFLWTGLIGGLVLALITSFAPRLAPWTAPLYAVTEGLALGAISAMYNSIPKYQGLPTQAVLLTFGVFLAMLVLYGFRVIRVTARVRAVLMSAIVGVLVFYLLTWVLRLFGVNMGFVYGASPLSIGISLLITGIAAFSLLLDFDAIEQGAKAGAPRYMSWYGAFGLVVGLVWLYLELLNLLRKLREQ